MTTLTSCSVPASEFEDRAFGFTSQVNFDAHKALLLTRDSHFKLEPPPPDRDIWKRPPPDFRFQAFAPNPAKRNSRDANQPWRYRSVSDQRVAQWRQNRRETVPLPPKGTVHLPQDDIVGATSVSAPPPFLRRFRTVRPYSAKLMAARRARTEVEMYEPPQPHDFRQYPPPKMLGLPEFLTHKEPDPYNIRHLLENRPIVRGPLHEVVNLREASGTMAGPVKQPEKWEQRLHLPTLKWPHRPLEYTRYRIPWRDPHDAFMENVEEKLMKKWSEEKAALQN